MCSKVVIVLMLISRTICFQNSLCGKDNSVDITKGTHLSNGDVYFNGVKYEKSQYYLENETKTERGCVCLKKICARKCCPFGYSYDVLQKMCVPATTVFDPPLWDDYYRRVNGINASEHFHFLFGKTQCVAPEVRVRVMKVFRGFHLRTDGKLYIELPNRIPPWQISGPDKYCIDTFVYEDPITGDVTMKLDALVCFADEQEDHDYMLSIVCMLISCVFIVATVGVYAWLPELRNLHGRVLMAYLICIFVGFAFLATMQILLTIDNTTTSLCMGLTFIIYYSLLAAFFWLNVMCFDIWWTFSGKRGLSLEKLSTKARFYAYAAYAFGVPTALTILLAALEFSGLPKHPLLPMLKDYGCFISGNAKLLYLYGPIVILCVANMVFFILTAVKIAQIKKQTSVLNSKESSMHDQHRKDTQRFTLYLKLFAVMGINWLLEVISAIYPKLNNFWRFTDAYNVLIGLIVFIIFVCKRKIFRLMKKRYKQLRGEPMSRTQTTSSRTTSCRDDIRMNSIKTNNNK